VIRTYLDYNASAPIRPDVRDAVAAALELTGNASSIHKEGRSVRALIEAARDEIANLVNGDPNSVVFTSGGTEANVTVLAPENVIATRDSNVPADLARCFISAVEHPSVLMGGRFRDQRLTAIAVGGDGVIDLAALRSAIKSHLDETGGAPFLVSVMLANNETGALQPVAEIVSLVHELGGVVHSDSVQAAGKIAIDIEALGVDFLTLSAHKMGGPQGAGAIVLGRDSQPLGAALLTGGGQELRRRAGTENVAAIAGFGVAARLAGEGLADMARIAALRDALENHVCRIAPEARIFSKNVSRLPNTSLFATAGVAAETALIALDLAGIAVSSGSACSSGKIEPSHVLKVMGVEPELAGTALRVSFGWNSKTTDVEKFIAAWSAIYERSRMEQAAA